MPVFNNNRAIIDTPMFQVMAAPPASATVGTCLTGDSARYLYFLVSAVSFHRYDTWADAWMQLASPPGGTVGLGTCLQWDSVSSQLWALITNGVAAPTFQVYSPATNTWTTKTVVNLPATFGTAGNMAMPTTGGGAASSDFIYLVGNNATVFYRYSISGNSWSTLTAALATMGGGCSLAFVPGYGGGGDRIVALRATASASLYYYSITGNSWTTIAYKPDTETFTTGTSLCKLLTGSPTPRLIITKDATGKIFELDLNGAGTMNMFANQNTVANSTAVAGSRMDTVVSPDSIEYVYLIPNTTAQILRTIVLY